MGEVRCDILTGGSMTCIFVRYVDTTTEKISSFKPPQRFAQDLNESVTHILFYRGTLPTFPSEISSLLPNLKSIDIFDCGLKAISMDDLKAFKNLERVKLDSNQITFLPGNLLEASPKLTHFGMSRNKINKIGPNIFESAKNLVEVDLSKNLTIDYVYKKEMGEGSLQELTEIIKKDCKLVESLLEMSIKEVTKGIDWRNADEVLFIAKQLKIEKLIENVESFTKDCV